MGLFSNKETPAKRSADEMAQGTGEAGPSHTAPAVASPAGPADAGNPPSEGTVLDASEEPIKDILLQVPLAELHQVGVDSLGTSSPLTPVIPATTARPCCPAAPTLKHQQA